MSDAAQELAMANRHKPWARRWLRAQRMPFRELTAEEKAAASNAVEKILGIARFVKGARVTGNGEGAR